MPPNRLVNADGPRQASPAHGPPVTYNIGRQRAHTRCRLPGVCFNDHRVGDEPVTEEVGCQSTH